MERHHQILRDKSAEEGKRDVQETKQNVQLNPAPPPPPSSSSSSPSHEFSFTISLHPSSAKPPNNNKTNKSPPPFAAAAIDLSPADEIFFHGHLLPLHLLSHLPVSPRSSTNSSDSFTLPIKELLQDNLNNNNNNNKTSFITRSSCPNHDDHDGDDDDDHLEYIQETSSHVMEAKGRGKSRSFSSLFGTQKRRKGFGTNDDDQQQQQKRKSKFEVLKKYMIRLVVPFLSSSRRSRNYDHEYLREKPYSYSSGNLMKKKKKEVRGRRGELFSAPASMRNSPTNSGILVASGTVTPNKSDSSMEELQAAIQAAIAHCKKSIAEEEDKTKLS